MDPTNVPTISLYEDSAGNLLLHRGTDGVVFSNFDVSENASFVDDAARLTGGNLSNWHATLYPLTGASDPASDVASLQKDSSQLQFDDTTEIDIGECTEIARFVDGNVFLVNKPNPSAQRYLRLGESDLAAL